MPFPVFVDPAIVDQPDRHRIEKMQFLPARPARDNEAGIFQNLQMLHDAETRHLEPGLQFLQRAAVALKKQVQEEASCRIGKCLEYVIVICHGGTIGD